MDEIQRKRGIMPSYSKWDAIITVGKGVGCCLFVVTLILFAAVTVKIFTAINEVQERPYMDEIFHVPQTQKYCAGNYSEWDPKITTLPGTYVVTSAVLTAWDFIWPTSELCSTFSLRAVNVGVSILNFCLIYCIVGSYNPDMCPLKRIVSAVNIGTFPVLYFFSFLYYTDAVATAFLLMMHCLFLNGKYGCSALAGAFAVFTRQTNIVWVFYHGVNSILGVLINRYGEQIFLLTLEWKKAIVALRNGGRVSKGKRNNKAKKGNKTVIRSTSQPPSLFRIWRECGDDFADHGCGYILVGVLFFIFLVYNGGIVVGDKQAHQATINIPQVFYFALVFGTFALPFLSSRISRVGFELLVPNTNNFAVMCLLSILVIFLNSPVHPYLLADNRHFTFYVWKRFYENIPFLRYVWIPFYIMVWTLIKTSMGVPKLLLYNYIFCTFINLIPQLLLEFRYFIPAYMFARLTFKNVTWYELSLEFCFYVSFNVITIYAFLQKPFWWDGNVEPQRFMW